MEENKVQEKELGDVNGGGNPNGRHSSACPKCGKIVEKGIKYERGGFVVSMRKESCGTAIYTMKCPKCGYTWEKKNSL